MTSILTGDIVNSRNIEAQIWMPILRNVLSKYGTEPNQWEIYRGDSFQLEIIPGNALKAAILIKASIKLIKGLDVRLAIGIGDKSYYSEKITASNGTAFINSGACFDGLKKSIIAIKSPFLNFDNQINVMLNLAQLTMNSWTQKSSEIVKLSIENPTLNQKDFAKILGRTQSAISKSLKISGYEEIMNMVKHYENSIENL
tara:strand:- start:34568 stop:35167 length:600 start_codon:yes stop_codon:yes gene_type:complete